MEETRTEISRNGNGNWKSRKAILTVAAFILPFTVSTICLFIKKMTAGQWIGFNEFLIPVILGLYSAANIGEKVGMARATK